MEVFIAAEMGAMLAPVCVIAAGAADHHLRMLVKRSASTVLVNGRPVTLTLACSTTTNNMIQA